jgi:hypothetical protein
MKSRRKYLDSRGLTVFGIILILFFGVGAISIVWLRMEISLVAKNCGRLEGKTEVVGREVHELRGQRSKSLRPSSLAVMVSGRLGIPSAGNTYHVSEQELNMAIKDRYYPKYSSQDEYAGTR